MRGRIQPRQFEHCFAHLLFPLLGCSPPLSLQDQMKSTVSFGAASSPKSTAAEWLEASLSAQKGAELHSGDSWLKLNFSLEVSNANECVKNPL